MELADERYVRELLHARYAAVLRKVPEAPGTKTFDYEMLADGARIAAVEVKRFAATPRTPENGWRRNQYGALTRKDNAPARVAAVIHKAARQLRGCSLPKVLVMLNDERQMDALDFEEAFNGFLDYGDEGTGYMRNAASAETDAVRRIREDQWSIDLYVWINRYDGSRAWRPSGPAPHEEPGPFFRFTTDAGYGLARNCFGAPEVPK